MAQSVKNVRCCGLASVSSSAGEFRVPLQVGRSGEGGVTNKYDTRECCICNFVKVSIRFIYYRGKQRG